MRDRTEYRTETESGADGHGLNLGKKQICLFLGILIGLVAAAICVILMPEAGFNTYSPELDMLYNEPNAGFSLAEMVMEHLTHHLDPILQAEKARRLNKMLIFSRTIAGALLTGAICLLAVGLFRDDKMMFRSLAVLLVAVTLYIGSAVVYGVSIQDIEPEAITEFALHLY